MLVGTAEQDSRDFRFRGRLEGRKGIAGVTGVCSEIIVTQRKMVFRYFVSEEGGKAVSK